LIDCKVTVYDCIEVILANYKNDAHFSYVQTFQLCSDISAMFRHFSYVQTFQLCSDISAMFRHFSYVQTMRQLFWTIWHCSIHTISTLTVNIKLVCTRRETGHTSSLSSCSQISYKYLFYLPTMYVYCLCSTAVICHMTL
jgi:hypothetical protein